MIQPGHQDAGMQGARAYAPLARWRQRGRRKRRAYANATYLDPL